MALNEQSRAVTEPSLASARVSGSALVSVRPFVQGRLGADTWHRFLERCSETARAVYAQGPVASSWYPLTVAQEGLSVVLELSSSGDPLRDYAFFNLDYGT